MKKMLLSISIFLVVVFLSTSVFAEYPYEVAWIRQMGTPSSDVASSVAIDSSGNAYVAGYTLGGLDGNTYAGSADLYLVKYDPSGTKLWTRQMGTVGNDVAQSVALDSSGNPYVSGWTTGAFEGYANAGREDIFLIRFEAPTVEAKIQNLIALITEMLNSGEIANKGIATSLISMLENAQSSLEQGNVTAAGNMLGAFVNHVEAQSGKGITKEEAAAALIEATNQILATLQP